MGENTNTDTKSRGWVKLWRTLFDNPRARDPEWLAVWIDFLLNATHTAYEATFQGKLITLRPGQLITGRFAQAERTGVHESKVRRIWSVMKSDHQIDQQAGNKNSLFTILNWHLYQGIDQQNGRQVTANRPTTGQQSTTNKNVEKEENEKHERERDSLPLSRIISDRSWAHQFRGESARDCLSRLEAQKQQIGDRLDSLTTQAYYGAKFVPVPGFEDEWQLLRKARSWHSSAMARQRRRIERGEP